MRKRQSLIVIILIYIVTAFLWFYLTSNYLFESIKTDTGVGYWLKEAEDLLFVAFTSILLYLLIRNFEQKRAAHQLETELHEAELTKKHFEHFMAITSISNDILWDWDIASDKVWRNDNYEKLFGYAPDKTFHSNSDDWLRYIHPEDKERMRTLIKNMLQGKENYLEAEYRFIAKNGKVLDILDRSNIYRDDNGEPIRVIGSMLDITSLRSFQRSLTASEEHYKKIVETAHEGIWQIDEVGITTFVNSSVAKLLGYSKSEMLGKFILDFVFEEDIRTAKDLMKQHLQGIKLQFEFKLKNKNGEAVWVLAKGAPVLEEGIYKGSIGMITDITTLKEFTQKLEKSERDYRLLFKKNPMPMWVYDEIHFHFLAVNNAALKHYGYTHEEFLKLKVTDIRPHHDVEQFLKSHNNTDKSIRNSGIWKHIKKNGELIDAEIVAQPIMYNGIKAHLILINDVTDKLKAEKELMRSYGEIKKLALHLQHARDDERKRIAREIHDELGQKITAVKMGLSWLDKQIDQSNPPLQAKVKETLAFVDESNLSIRKILNELRTDFLSNFGTGEALKWLIRQFEKQNNFVVQLDIENNIDQISDEVSGCIYRVIQESLTNISKYANASIVKIHLKNEEKVLAVCIEDDGCGFDPKEIHSDWSYGFLGMRERVTSLQGHLSIESAPGKGTKLCIKVPVVQKMNI